MLHEMALMFMLMCKLTINTEPGYGLRRGTLGLGQKAGRGDGYGWRT